MKKIIYFILCLFMMIPSTKAITLSCPEVASPGEVISIHVEGQGISGIKANYQNGSEFIYQDISFNSSFKKYYFDKNGFSIGNVINQDALAMDIKFKVGMDIVSGAEYTLGLTNIETSDYSYQDSSVDNVSCKVKILTDINTLDSLSIDGVNISPNFSKDITSYQGTTKLEKIVIQAIASDSGSRVEGDIGEKYLNYGVNIFTIRVISARGNIKEYNLYITREMLTNTSTSNDASLKSLTISTGKIDFKKDKFLYSILVDYKIEKIEVKAIPNSDKASVKINYPTQLVVGENIIKITVTAEDGTIANYVIIVNRKDKLSSDATIKNLKIKNYDISFQSNVYKYILEIDNEDKLDIEVVLNDDKAKYTIRGNKNLKNNGIIEIEVVAEDGSKKVYQISIKKSGESNSSSIINYLKLLPLIGFVILIFGILVVKILNLKFIKQ